MELANITFVANKPNRLTDKKDKDYDVRYARWAVFHANNEKHNEHMRNIQTNINFFSSNKQWSDNEDFVGFLMDTSGNTTNRIKVEMNYIQILVNQYVGNADGMNITSRVQSFSPMVHTRKESELNKLLFKFNVAVNATDTVKQRMFDNLPLGGSESETVELFEATYVDKYVQAMNGLMRYGETVNKFNNLKKEVAESLALSGMAIIKPEAYNGDYRFRWVQSKNFFFDRSARKYNLSDAAYMGEWHDALPSEVLEQYPKLTREDAMAVEDYVSSMSNGHTIGKDRIRKYAVYWRDITYDDWGYIEDEFGDLVLERINYIDEYNDEPKYTEKDVVPISKLNKYQRDIVKKKKGDSGKAIVRNYSDQWRFCEFIPHEYISSTYNKNNNPKDIVLDSGIVKYQEPSIYSPYNMEAPYKVGFYIYTDGFVYSPIDIAINPQRVANRIMSVVENMMNNSRGSGTILAKESVDRSDMDYDDILIKMKHNEPIVLPGQAFGGVQNAVTRYDATIGEGAMNFLSMANVFLQTIEKITGVNEQMKGQQGKGDQLVGTMQLMIQRGSVIQERFYSSIREIFRQCYQALATSGKRLYIQQKPKLISIVGDDSYDIIELTRDMTLEDFRVSVRGYMSAEDERNTVDQMLMQFLSAGLIDRTGFAKIVGRGSIDDMWDVVRDFAKMSAEAEKQTAVVQQQQMQQQGQMQQQNIDKAFQSEQADRETQIVKEAIKQEGRNTEKL